jgi:hypothetical protein
MIPVSASSWVPISAYYPYDDHIRLTNTHIKWTDGYTVFSQEAFQNNIDYSTNKDTIMYLSEAKSLFDFLTDTSLDNVDQGGYVLFSINAVSYFSPELQYITVIENNLYLNPVSSDNSFFRFILNDNGSFSLFYGAGLYVTVEDTTPFNLILSEKADTGEKHTQEFLWHEYENTIYFSTKTKNPAFISGIGSEYEERFWSFSKVGPEKGRMRACGFLPFKNYSTNDIYKNDYLFNVIGYNFNYKPTGLITDHTFVRYYNELNNKRHNKDVEVYEVASVSSVYISHLFDLPYNTKININRKDMAMNFANLKNIMTPEYEYRANRLKIDCACDPYTIGCGIVADEFNPTPCDFVVS